MSRTHTVVNINFADAFSESDHPRKGGKFASKGGSGLKKITEKQYNAHKSWHKQAGARGGGYGNAEYVSVEGGVRRVQTHSHPNHKLTTVEEHHHPDGSKTHYMRK